MAETLHDPEEARGEDPGAASSPSAVADLTDTLVADLPVESIPITITRSDNGRSLDDYVAIQGWTRAQIKESGARQLATALVWIFGLSINLVLFGAILIVAITRDPQEAEVYSATLSSLLDELGAFSSAVFAPLLAFVLGYYFGEKQQR